MVALKKQYKNTCNKKRYSDELEGLLALTRIERGSKAEKEECHVYYCGNCDSWHLSSQRSR